MDHCGESFCYARELQGEDRRASEETAIHHANALAPTADPRLSIPPSQPSNPTQPGFSLKLACPPTVTKSQQSKQHSLMNPIPRTSSLSSSTPQRPNTHLIKDNMDLLPISIHNNTPHPKAAVVFPSFPQCK